MRQVCCCPRLSDWQHVAGLPAQLSGAALQDLGLAQVPQATPFCWDANKGGRFACTRFTKQAAIIAQCNFLFSSLSIGLFCCLLQASCWPCSRHACQSSGVTSRAPGSSCLTCCSVSSPQAPLKALKVTKPLLAMSACYVTVVNSSSQFKGAGSPLYRG